MRRPRSRLRAVLIGGLGGAGLIAFSVGAFSFFSGLADPRVRTPRMMPVAAKMPDLKDGLPALTSEDGSGAAAQAASFNLPRPSPAEPQSAQPDAAQTEPPLRSAMLPAAPAPVEASQDSPAAAGIGGPRQAADAAPPIQNAAVIADAPRTAALVPPAKAETVKAKAGPGTFAALPAEVKPRRDPEPTVHEASKPAKAAAQKTAAHSKPAAVRSVAEAAPPAPQQPAATPPADDEDAIPGSRQIRAGLKAIGGMFGSDSD